MGATDTALAVPVKLKELAYCIPPDGAATPDGKTPAGVDELAGDAAAGAAADGGDGVAAAAGAEGTPAGGVSVVGAVGEPGI